MVIDDRVNLVISASHNISNVSQEEVDQKIIEKAKDYKSKNKMVYLLALDQLPKHYTLHLVKNVRFLIIEDLFK